MARESDDLYYLGLWRTCHVLSAWQTGVRSAVQRVLSGYSRYVEAVRGTTIPWIFVGLIHEMECDCDWACQILNGQRWDSVTTMYPKGLGPWPNWEASARYALTERRLVHQDINKGIPGLLRALEAWNGWGYRSRGVHSPYLWSGSQHGVGAGKFTSDGVYLEQAVSAQVGAAVILHEIAISRGLDGVLDTVSVPADAVPATSGLPVTFDGDGNYIRREVVFVQRCLNAVLMEFAQTVAPLKEDGWAGPQTSAAVKTIFGRYLLGDLREHI